MDQASKGLPSIEEAHDAPVARPPRRRLGPRSLAWLLIVLTLALMAAAGAGVACFSSNDDDAHPNEDTARFVPDETAVYFSLNLKAGSDQLESYREIMAQFGADPAFDTAVEDWERSAEDETGIAFRADVAEWLGPELAVAVIDIGALGVGAEVVAFIGTTDAVAAEESLRTMLDYVEGEAEIEFEEGITAGFPSFSYDAGVIEAHIVVTEEYLVFATDDRLLDDTLDMMADSRGSLFEDEEFLRERGLAADPRFAMLYVDVDRVVREARAALRTFGGAEADDLLDEVEEELPSTVAATASFIEMGIVTTVAYDTPEGGFALPDSNALKSLDLLPFDTLALVSSTGVGQAWDTLMEGIQSAGQSPVDPAELLRLFEQQLGLSIEDDIIGWMTGEAALALLPSEFIMGPDGAVQEALVNAVAMLEFDDRLAAEDSIESIVDFLRGTGVTFNESTIGDVNAVLAELPQEMAGLDYQPGYMLLEDHAVVGSRRQALEQVADTRGGSVAPLRGAPGLSRALEAAGRSPDALLYASIGRIVTLIVDTLSAPDRDTYEAKAAPFIEPIEVLLSSVESDEERTTYTTVLTFK